ncbi:hypothetical protein C0991_000870 [Blastosporella zonata]|nr:hypothetical protein C0991_000870 [Blastosporella zonata]
MSALNKNRLNPFHQAILSGNTPVVQFFLSRLSEGCHPSKAIADGHTPLQLAIASGSASTVPLFLKNATVHDVEWCWEQSPVPVVLKDVLETKKGFVSRTATSGGPPLSRKAALQAEMAHKLAAEQEEKARKIADEHARAAENLKRKEECYEASGRGTCQRGSKAQGGGGGSPESGRSQACSRTSWTTGGAAGRRGGAAEGRDTGTAGGGDGCAKENGDREVLEKEARQRLEAEMRQREIEREAERQRQAELQRKAELAREAERQREAEARHREAEARRREAEGRQRANAAALAAEAEAERYARAPERRYRRMR